MRDFFRARWSPPRKRPLPFSGSPRMPAFSSPDGRGAPPPDVPPAPPATYPLGHLPRKAAAAPDARAAAAAVSVRVSVDLDVRNQNENSQLNRATSSVAQKRCIVPITL